MTTEIRSTNGKMNVRVSLERQTVSLVIEGPEHEVVKTVAEMPLDGAIWLHKTIAIAIKLLGGKTEPALEH